MVGQKLRLRREGASLLLNVINADLNLVHMYATASNPPRRLRIERARSSLPFFANSCLQTACCNGCQASFQPLTFQVSSMVCLIGNLSSKLYCQPGYREPRTVSEFKPTRRYVKMNSSMLEKLLPQNKNILTI
jgi:hypothetical protein